MSSILLGFKTMKPKYFRFSLALVLAMIIGACDGDSFLLVDQSPTDTGGGGSGGSGIPALVAQLVGGGALFDSALSGDGGTVVYVSNDDPLGTNPTGGEQIFSVNSGTGVLTQITDLPDVALVFFSNFDITDNGSEVVFSSSADFTGGNPGLLNHIFIAATDGSGFTQVTPGGFGGGDAQISGDGQLVVFSSFDDLTGGNPSGSRQIFSVARDGSNLMQVTTGSPSVNNLAFAENGSKIIYDSTADPFGTNPENNVEIFVVNIDGTGHMQLTVAASGRSNEPRISDDGSRAVFVSDSDLVAGRNSDGGLEIFVVETSSGVITQVTESDEDSGGFSNATPGALDISGNGEWVVFNSRGNLALENPGNSHTIFWADRSGAVIQQLLRATTVPPSVNSRTASNPRINNNGTLVLFESDSNYNPLASSNGEKLYVAARQ
jgi:Tol biopolymer transport system component